MSEATRSPFGAVLRAYRQQRGLSQAALADLIVERTRDAPAFAALGGLSDRTIANLEALQADPSRFVRPRPNTVRILAAGLDIPPGSPEERAFLNAAEETRKRAPARALPPPVAERHIFVREGREEHFQRLRHAWTLARAGQPQVLLLAGDAGAGKTHMIRELCLEAQSQDRTVRVAWGECTGGASSVSPYLPFLQATNQLLGLVRPEQATRTGEAPDPARQAATIDSLLTIAPALIGTMADEAALTACVERLKDTHPHLQDQLQRVLGVRNASDTSGRLDQMVRFLSTLSATSPIILVLEDLHWAGEMTAALLLHVQRQLTLRHGLPILVIGSYRPSDLPLHATSNRHPLEPVINEIGRQVGDVVVDLGTTIGPIRGRAFITGLLHTLSIATDDEHPLAELLFNRTEGHPLFAIELIRWLQENGGMDQDVDGLWHLRPSAMHVNPPGKIRAVIAERIDRLPAHLRSILEAAAVQGGTVTINFLAGVETLSAHELDDAIDTQLVSRYRLLQPQNPVQAGEQRLHIYTFQHALFQEYLYETLSLRERERLHGLTAEKAARLMGDAPHMGSGEIAFHFERAHRYKDAAQHAYAAATHALLQLNYDLASHWLKLTEDYARQVDDRWHIHAAQNGQVTVMRGLGDLDAGIRLASAVAINARHDGFGDLEAESEDLLGQAYFDKGDLQATINHMKRAAALYQSIGQHAKMSGTEAMLSHTYYRLGAYDDALVHAHRSYEIAHQLDDHAHAAEALLAAANCEVDLGMYETAIATYQRAEVIYARAKEVRGELLTALNTGLCRIQLQEWVEAVAILRQARHITEVLRTPRLKVSVCHYLSLALEGLGDYAAARQEALHSRRLREGFDQHGTINDNVATLLRIALAEGNLDEAKNHLQHLQAWTDDCGGEGIEDPILVFLSMATAYGALGDPGSACRAIGEGHALVMERASHIHDADARRSYLEKVPTNRRLIAWHERGHDPDE